jgi:hypothetical protein
MIKNANEVVALGLVLSMFGCDRRRDEPQPVQAPLPAPTPPPVASAAAVPAAPVRLTVAKGPPDGVVVDGWVAGGRCNIETINEPAGKANLTVKPGVPMKVSGWALDPKGTKIPDALHVRFLSPTAGDYFGTVSNRFARDDVNKQNHAEAGSTSGFSLDFDSNLLPPGTYTVTLIMLFGEKAYVCDNGRKVIRE